MCFMQIESVLQTINRSEPAKNRFSVALVTFISFSSSHRHFETQILIEIVLCKISYCSKKLVC